jgi:ABC-type lipoprotein release transport system permease subunit
MLMFRVALRNVFRQRRRTILTVLTMFGGYTLAVLSFGLSDGTYNRVIDMFTRNQLGHIQIHHPGYLDRPSLYKNIPDYEELGGHVERVRGVACWAPRIKAAGLASVGEKTSGVSILGIDPVHENTATRFDRKIVAGRGFSDRPSLEAVLGAGLARVLKATPGDTLVIVSQAADGSMANDAYTVVGLVESGNTLDDRSTLYLHIEDAQELFVLEGRAHEIAIVTDRLNQVPEVTDSLKIATDGLKLDVDPWQVFARSFYRAMLADKEGTWYSLLIIIIIVAVGVLNTVLMTVLERRREYGVLRAVGTAPSQIFRLVTVEVMLMALFSIVIGVICGYVLNDLLAEHGMSVGLEVTYGGIKFDRMYSENNLRAFVIPALCVFFTAFIVSLFPAGRAAYTPPARAMRTH